MEHHWKFMEHHGNFMKHCGKFMGQDGNLMEHDGNLLEHDRNFREHDGNFWNMPKTSWTMMKTQLKLLKTVWKPPLRHDQPLWLLLVWEYFLCNSATCHPKLNHSVSVGGQKVRDSDIIFIYSKSQKPGEKKMYYGLDTDLYAPPPSHWSQSFVSLDCSLILLNIYD